MTGNRPLVETMISIENNEDIDAGVEGLRPLIEAVVANDTIRGVLQGDWAGHALHPAIVVLPLGLWSSATTLDLIRPGRATESAQLLTGLGILSTLPAVLTGAAEMSTATQKQKRVGLIHVLANSTALGLQVGSWVARRAGHHRSGTALSLAAVAMMSWGGYLGGHLSVARKVGSHDPAFGEE